MLKLILISLLIFQVVQCAPPKCVKAKIQKVNTDWMRKAGKSGWLIPLQNSFSPGSTDTSRIKPNTETKKYKNEVCSQASLKSIAGPLHISMICRFDEIEKQSCELQTAANPTSNFFKYFGDFETVKTDNKTYIVQTACLFEREPTWMVLSTLAKLPDDVVAGIFKTIEEYGFKREGRAKPDDQIMFQGLQEGVGVCDPTKGIAPGLPSTSLPETEFTKMATSLLPQ